MAWAQVALVQGHSGPNRQTSWASSWRLGLGAFAIVIVLGLTCHLAIRQQWLEPQWEGVLAYIVPLVLWQGCACMSAAFSHRPFQTQTATIYSWACITLSGIQATVLFIPLNFTCLINPMQHMTVFALMSSLGLLGLTLWMSRLR